MSRKHRHPRQPGKPSSLTSALLSRRHTMREPRDHIMLQIRMFRNMLVEREGTEEMWGELAGIINVFGVYTHHHKLPAFPLIVAAADALRVIEARHNRVGGRWVAIDGEIGPLTLALEAIDHDLMPTMPIVEFVRIATAINASAAEERNAA